MMPHSPVSPHNALLNGEPAYIIRIEGHVYIQSAKNPIEVYPVTQIGDNRRYHRTTKGGGLSDFRVARYPQNSNRLMASTTDPTYDA